MNKATRILSNMTSDNKVVVTSALGGIAENADVGRQAQYINDLLDYAESHDISMQNVMHKCGGGCLEKEVVDIAKGIYAKAANVEQFLTELNESGIGGGNLHIENGKIIAVYKNCYCDIPYEVKNLNPTYCQCSAGWFQHLFSQVFEKTVLVKIIDTITNGASECTFEIYCL